MILFIIHNFYYSIIFFLCFTTENKNIKTDKNETRMKIIIKEILKPEMMI